MTNPIKLRVVATILYKMYIAHTCSHDRRRERAYIRVRSADLSKSVGGTPLQRSSRFAGAVEGVVGRDPAELRTHG